MAPPKTSGAPRGTVTNTVLSIVTYTIRALPLPPAIYEFLSSHIATIAKVASQQRQEELPEGDEIDDDGLIDVDATTGEQTQAQAQEEARAMSTDQFWAELERLCAKAGGDWSGAADRIWAFGPKRVGTCLLLDPPGATQPRLRERARREQEAHVNGHSDANGTNEDEVEESDDPERKAEVRLLKDFENSIEAGFQMATFQGPLCAEPVVGMGWIVEKVEIHKEADEGGESRRIVSPTAETGLLRQLILSWQTDPDRLQLSVL